LTHVVSSLAYPNLLGTKRLGCCCCSTMQIIHIYCTTPSKWYTKGITGLFKAIGSTISCRDIKLGSRHAYLKA
jgi:hypothetical protein